MKIARVFPTRTRLSPIDRDAYFGPPDLFAKGYDEVHISVVFSWDRERAERLAYAWSGIAETVKIGGPAIDGEGNGFIPGRYVRPGVTVTSRGCPHRCPWCQVRSPLVELEVQPGNNIIDNNLLACSDQHLERVFEMLRGQTRIKLTGGLEARRITDKIAERLRSLRMQRLYTAYDHPDNFRAVERAITILRKHFKRRFVHCYVLVGHEGDTMSAAEERLRQVLELGGMPFAMLYRGEDGRRPEPAREWGAFQKGWLRPPLIRLKMRQYGISQ